VLPTLPPFNNPPAPPLQIHVILCLGRDQLHASSCAWEGTLLVEFGICGDAEVKKAELCGMHSADKIGQSAVGHLTRSKAKVIVNPFAEAVAVAAAVVRRRRGRHRRRVG